MCQPAGRSGGLPPEESEQWGGHQPNHYQHPNHEAHAQQRVGGSIETWRAQVILPPSQKASLQAAAPSPHWHARSHVQASSFGYFHHSNDYWQYTVEKCLSKPVYDLWKYNETFDGPATFYQNGPSCSQDNQKPKNNETCVYEEEILTNEVLNIINAERMKKKRLINLDKFISYLRS